MAAEAQYAEMWVQDATTMATYQAASAAAGVLTAGNAADVDHQPGCAAAASSAALAADSTAGTTQALLARAPRLPFGRRLHHPASRPRRRAFWARSTTSSAPRPS